MNIFHVMSTQAFKEPRRGEFKDGEFCPNQALIEKVVVALEQRKKEKGGCLLGEIVLIKETDDQREMLVLLRADNLWAYIFKNPDNQDYIVKIVRTKKGFNLDNPPAKTFRLFKLQRDQNNENQPDEGLKSRRNIVLTVDETFEGAVDNLIGWIGPGSETTQKSLSEGRREI